jgi:lysozyme
MFERMQADAAKLIAQFESFLPESRFDKIGEVWDIGYGTTIYPNGTRVKEGEKVTKEKALEYLNYHVTKVVFKDLLPLIKRYSPPYRVNIALISLAYNCGTRVFKDDTILKGLATNNYGNAKNIDKPTGLAAGFLKYVYAQKQFIQGLQNRRIAEINYYNGRPNV